MARHELKSKNSNFSRRRCSSGPHVACSVLILLSLCPSILSFSQIPSIISTRPVSVNGQIRVDNSQKNPKRFYEKIIHGDDDFVSSYEFSLSSTSSSSETHQATEPDSPVRNASKQSKIEKQTQQLERTKYKTQHHNPRKKHVRNNNNNHPRSNGATHRNNSNTKRCSIRQNHKRKVRHLYSKAREMERRGLWKESCEILEYIVLDLEPTDAHSYLALARLESRRERGQFRRWRQGGDSGSNEGGEIPDEESNEDGKDKGGSRAREIFETGTYHCPESVHLWHAWAMHEQSLGNLEKARELLEKALALDPGNGYVCHAYGMMEIQNGNFEHAKELWNKGVTNRPSAALVCSLGQLYVSTGDPQSARELYSANFSLLPSERERIEVYLAAASLEETEFNDVAKASELLKLALNDGRTQDSRPYVALARLGSESGSVDDNIVRKRLKEICTKQMERVLKGDAAFPVKDGRLFNAWAKLESKSGRLKKAKDVLKQGMQLYPEDHTLLQAAGNVEERLGNVTAARDLYGASLMVEPSAPTLIAYAMLELRSPSENNTTNITMVRRLFQEALLIDPKHGPAYNAYGNLERRQGNVERAKQLYQEGINANCTDASSVYHGLGKLYLSLGEIEQAIDVLQKGLDFFEANEFTHVQRNENVAFLAHTLGMIELNINNNVKRAKSILEQGLKRCRNSSPLLLGVAMCESRVGNEQRARQMFEKSIIADPDHAQAWQAFGVMEMKAGNYRSAKTLFECGLKNSPRHGALWQAYGTLESRKGNVANARLLFAAGIQKCPKHVPLYQAWACLELRDGDVLTAKRLIGEALTMDKRNGSGWLVAAKIEEKSDNHGLVGLILRRGIECSPNDVELYRALAEHEISRGKIDNARELLERGLEIDPLNAPLYHSLAELEARVFNIEGLAKLNKRAAELFQADAMTPSLSSSKNMQVWSKKIKHGRSTKIPDTVAALAEKIGVGNDADLSIAGVSLDEVDPESLVERICGFNEENNLMLEARASVSNK